jgi:hypothetical protein
MGQAGDWLLLIGVYVGLRLYAAAISFYRYAAGQKREEPESKEAIK